MREMPIALRLRQRRLLGVGAKLKALESAGFAYAVVDTPC
jgi:hypothetical protein